MHVSDRYRIEVRIPCGHDTPCVIDRFSVNDKDDSNRQLAAVVGLEPAEMVRRRRVRGPEAPVERGDVF